MTASDRVMSGAEAGTPGPITAMLQQLLAFLEWEIEGAKEHSGTFVFQVLLLAGASFAFFGYMQYRWLLKHVPHVEATTPRPLTPERQREALPPPVAVAASPSRAPREWSADAEATKSPVQQLIQQFGGIKKATADAGRAAAAALPAAIVGGGGAGAGATSTKGSVTPRLVPPVTPASLTPPAVTASAASTDMSSDGSRAVLQSVEVEAVDAADGVLAAPPSGVSVQSQEAQEGSVAALDMQWGAHLGAREPLTADVSDGTHHIDWQDGSEYLGEWTGGRPHGRGTFVWPSGVRYEGEWVDGREDGVGTLVSPDGAAFYGFWADGLMQGQGVYKPATPENKRAEVIFLRKYERGVLKAETVLRVADLDLRRVEKKGSGRPKTTDKTPLVKSQVPRVGEIVYATHHSYELVRHLQLGIMFSIAQATSALPHQPREPSTADFGIRVKQYFPKDSSYGATFKWKDYCPAVFERLRRGFRIDNPDYLLSLTGVSALRELPSPGKSGSVFYLSDDDRFMVKTVSREEMKLLLHLLPAYLAHCTANPDTLLTRFYGMHRITPASGHKVHLIIMGNVFPTDIRLHRKYDLKGSTYGRTVGAAALSEPTTVLKDLDLDIRLQISSMSRTALLDQVTRDTQLLEKLHIMDYSLLLGVHFPAWGDSQWAPPQAPPAESRPNILSLMNPTLSGRQAVHHTHTTTRDVYAQDWPPASAMGDPRSSASVSRLGGRRADVAHLPTPVPDARHGPAGGAAAGAAGHKRGGSQQWDPNVEALINRAMGDGKEMGPRAPPATPFASLEGQRDSTAQPDTLRDDSPIRLANGRATHLLNGGANSCTTTVLAGRPGSTGRISMRRLVTPVRIELLGAGLPATALPVAEGAQPEPAILYFGIIDFLQEYNFRKRTEHFLKAAMLDGNSVSVINPRKYAKRFRSFLANLFVARYNSSAS